MKATDTFRNPQFGHNCAQAVANKYKELYSDQNIVEAYAPYVGGSAPGGLCGALFAVNLCSRSVFVLRSETVSKSHSLPH